MQWYNFGCFIPVCNLVSCPKDSVKEYGAEENICSCEKGNNRRMEESA
jgi:hypothetical protein